MGPQRLSVRLRHQTTTSIRLVVFILSRQLQWPVIARNCSVDSSRSPLFGRSRCALPALSNEKRFSFFFSRFRDQALSSYYETNRRDDGVGWWVKNLSTTNGRKEMGGANASFHPVTAAPDWSAGLRRYTTGPEPAKKQIGVSP